MAASVSMSRLFPECVITLRSELRPLHYRELTGLALRRLRLNPAAMQRDTLLRVEEDVREKLLGKRRHGTDYVPEPYFMAVLRDWFEASDPQGVLFNRDAWSYPIPGSSSAALSACVNLGMRLPHMIQKHPDADLFSRVLGAARGLVVEHHISELFRGQWPEFYMKPANESLWTRPCSHDFKLNLPNGVTYLVDVMGPHLRDDLYALESKRPVSLHIAAELSGTGVLWRGWLTGNEAARLRLFTGEEVNSPARLIVMLNCWKAGIDWDSFRSAAVDALGLRSAA